MSLSDRTIYIFTPEVFEVVGSPNITDDGIASGFSTTSNIKMAIDFKNKGTLGIKGNFVFKRDDSKEQILFVTNDTNGLFRVFINKVAIVLWLYRDGKQVGFSLNHQWKDGEDVSFNLTMSENYRELVCTTSEGVTTSRSSATKVVTPSFNLIELSSRGAQYFTGSIDLKQFSIQVDGKEVFSGSRKIELGAPVLDDSEHLPKVVTNVLGIDDILLAIDPEVQLLRVDISDLIKELYVKTTDKFIRRWENDFSLPYDSSLTLQQRRQRVLNKLARKKTLTWENLKLLIRNNIDNPQFYIMNDSENYHFTIMVQTSNYNELTKALDETIPAYLTYDIIVTEYFKRCGTFASGTNPL